MSEQKGFDVEEMTSRVKDAMKRNTFLVGIGGIVLLAGGGYWLAWAMWGAAMGLSGVILAGLLACIPYFGAVPLFNWLEVKKIAIIEKIAADNPIQTQWALWGKDSKRVQAISKNLDEYNTGIHSYELEVDEQKNNLAPDSYKAKKDEIGMMRADLALQREELTKQRKDLDVWERLITQLQTEWNLSIKRDKLNASQLSLRQKDMTDRIRNNASLTAVRESIARRRAQIENSYEAAKARAEQSPASVSLQSISHNPSDVIEMPVTQTAKVAQ